MMSTLGQITSRHRTEIRGRVVEILCKKKGTQRPKLEIELIALESQSPKSAEKARQQTGILCTSDAVTGPNCNCAAQAVPSLIHGLKIG